MAAPYRITWRRFVVAWAALTTALALLPVAIAYADEPHVTSVTDPGHGDSLVVSWDHVDPSNSIYWNTSGTLANSGSGGSGMPMACIGIGANPTTTCTGYAPLNDSDKSYTITGLAQGIAYSIQVGTYIPGSCSGCSDGQNWSTVVTGTVGPPTGGGGGSGGGGGGTGGAGAASISVQKIQGEVTVRHPDGSSEPLKAGSVHDGDLIVTGKHGRVELLFDGTSVLTLGPNSNFTPQSDNDQLSAGEAFVHWVRGVKRRRFQLRTPTAICGVRGTIFTVEVTRNGTRVRTYTDAVAVTNTRGRHKRTVNVKAGFESTVSGSNSPARPQAFTPPAHPFWWG